MSDDREPATVLVAIRVDLLRALLAMADDGVLNEADEAVIDEARAVLPSEAD